MNDTYDINQLQIELRRDEGWRQFPYYDTDKNESIGCGRNLTARGVSDSEILLMWTHDVEDVEAALDRNLSWWRGLDPVRQRVLLNLGFNLGWGGLSQFARFLSAMHQGRWNDAAQELVNSRWHSEVGARALRLEAMVRTGEAV